MFGKMKERTLANDVASHQPVLPVQQVRHELAAKLWRYRTIFKDGVQTRGSETMKPRLFDGCGRLRRLKNHVKSGSSSRQVLFSSTGPRTERLGSHLASMLTCRALGVDAERVPAFRDLARRLGQAAPPHHHHRSRSCTFLQGFPWQGTAEHRPAKENRRSDLEVMNYTSIWIVIFHSRSEILNPLGKRTWKNM